MTNGKILIIEDDESIQELLEIALTSYDYTPTHARDGIEGLLLFDRINPDLVLMDSMMPNLDGIGTCKEIRKVSNVPIIFMSCKKDSSDIIEGLSAGGDDYVTKPFKIEELIARIQSNLRRSKTTNYELLKSSSSQKIVVFDELKIDYGLQKVYYNDVEIPLSLLEYKLLYFFVQHPNEIFSTNDLYAHIWGINNHGDTRTVNVHLSNLRKKIEKDSSNPKFILTVRGSGFVFKGIRNGSF